MGDSMTSISSDTGQDKITFGGAVVERLRDKGWHGDADFSPSDFSIKLGENKPVLYLDNSYADWLAAPDDTEQAEVVDRLVRVAMETLAMPDELSFEATAPNLLPAIRSRAYIDNLWMAVGFDRAHSFSHVSSPFCDALSIVLTINGKDSIATISPRQLKDWGKTFDEVLTVANANLKRFSLKPFERQDGGYYLLSSDDAYDPSVLLRPEIFEALELKGLPVAVAVTRACVVVAGSQDSLALKEMAAFVEAAYGADPRAISRLPLVLDKGEWRQFIPDRAGYPMIHRLRSLQHLTDCRNQLDILTVYYEKTGREVYVAEVDAIEDGEHLVTWTSLTDGIVTLLPQSDIVIVAPPEMKSPFARRFGDLMTVAGQMRLEPDTWPPRYVFDNGLDRQLADFLRDRYPQPQEFPDIGAKR